LILAEQVALFEQANPDVRLDFVLKKPSGKGGILDFLLTTSAVVPDLLPDLALIDVDQLEVAVQAGLVQPLGDLLAADLQTDLHPFAREANTFDSRLYGLQVWADLDHLVYNIGKMTIPPRSWPGVLSNPGPYIFPAGGQSGLVNDAFLIQYLAVRGEPAADEPFLQEEALTAVLQFYQDGLSRGIFPAGMVNYHSTDDCWRDYVAGRAALTQVSAHRYLAERAGLSGSAPAAIPAANGPGAPIARGWSLALITADPARQSLAVQFMAQILAPDVSAAWTRAAGYLPTCQAALANWDQADAYSRFLGQQLEAARPRPRLANYAQVAAALQDAVEAVLSGSATPEEAAATAVASAP
jgi:multiple sugar transport system substrate-binding protein